MTHKKNFIYHFYRHKHQKKKTKNKETYASGLRRLAEIHQSPTRFAEKLSGSDSAEYFFGAQQKSSQTA